MTPKFSSASPFNAFFLRLYALIEAQFQTKYWALKLLVLAVVIAGAVQCPRYTYVYRYAVAGTEINDGYENFRKQVASPFSVRSYDGNSHASKMQFRVSIALLVKVLQLPTVAVFVLQFIFGVLMYICLIKLLHDLTNDRVAVVLLTVGWGCTYYGCAYMLDTNCFFDSFTYATLLFMMVVKRPIILFGLMLFSAFVDERAIIVAPVILVWYLVQGREQTEHFHWATLLKSLFFNPKSMALVAACLTYFVIRLGIVLHYDIKTATGLVGLSALAYNSYKGYIGIGLLSGMESYWAVLLLAGVALYSSKKYKLLTLVVLAISPIMLGAFLVLDITRSLAYGMPVVLVSLVILKPYFTQGQLRHFALGLLGASFLIPTTYILGNVNISFSVFNYLISIVST